MLSFITDKNLRAEMTHMYSIDGLYMHFYGWHIPADVAEYVFERFIKDRTYKRYEIERKFSEALRVASSFDTVFLHFMDIMNDGEQRLLK
tara:strand:- start:917 stop:1186 length:270 start_codon:yes stop_codon:yes gene_type:complete